MPPPFNLPPDHLHDGVIVWHAQGGGERAILILEVDNGQAVQIRDRLSRPIELKLGTWMNPETGLGKSS